MNEKVLIIISEIILGGTVIVALAIILMASWYDLRVAASKKQLQRTVSKLTKSRQPFITIVIYTARHTPLTTECLDSIIKNNYVNYRIVVASHGSSSKTRQILKQYQKSHPKLILTHYTGSASLTHEAVLQRAMKKVSASEFVLTLPGSSLVAANTLRNCVAQFINDNRLAHLHLRQQLSTDVSIQTLTSHFLALSKNITYKALSALHALQRNPSPTVTFSRQSPLPNPQSRYMSSMTHAQIDSIAVSPHWSITQTSIIILVWLIIISIAAYWMWTAATLKSNAFLTLSWTTVCIWLLAILWSDTLTRLSRKIELTLTVPFMYFLLYVHIIADLLRSIWRLIKSIPLKNMAGAFQAELYSARY
jgi:hypothetical protein